MNGLFWDTERWDDPLGHTKVRDRTRSNTSTAGTNSKVLSTNVANSIPAIGLAGPVTSLRQMPKPSYRFWTEQSCHLWQMTKQRETVFWHQSPWQEGPKLSLSLQTCSALKGGRWVSERSTQQAFPIVSHSLHLCHIGQPMPSCSISVLLSRELWGSNLQPWDFSVLANEAQKQMGQPWIINFSSLPFFRLHQARGAGKTRWWQAQAESWVCSCCWSSALRLSHPGVSETFTIPSSRGVSGVPWLMASVMLRLPVVRGLLHVASDAFFSPLVLSETATWKAKCPASGWIGCHLVGRFGPPSFLSPHPGEGRLSA